MNLREIVVRPVGRVEEERFQALMQEHHYLGRLPKEGDDELNRTNEIKMAIPLLDSIEIQGKTITADALLTQRKFV